jgi:hypothetical protein
METAYFVRQAEELYGEEVVEEIGELFEAEHACEAFFGVLGQIDLLIAEDNVDITDAFYYNFSDWTLLDIVLCAKEEGVLATKQDKPSASMIVLLAEAVQAIALDLIASAAIARAIEDGERELAAELDERQKNIEIVRKSSRQTIEWMRTGEDARPGMGALDIAIEEAAQEETAPTASQPKSVTLASGFTIRVDE